MMFLWEGGREGGKGVRGVGVNSLPTTPIIAFILRDCKGELYRIVSELFLRHCRIVCCNLDSWY